MLLGHAKLIHFINSIVRLFVNVIEALQYATARILTSILVRGLAAVSEVDEHLVRAALQVRCRLRALDKTRVM